MIRLTDEEIEATLVPEGARSELVVGQIVTKAQLEKVVVWLDKQEFYKDAMGDSGKSFRDTVKRALLEEIG